MARLRQAVLVARDLDRAVGALRSALGLGEPFRDPAVAAFGLRNAVMALGDTFVEVVSPVAADTAAGRHLDRIGGDGGYMVMFELDDVAGARRRASDLGIREVFAVELEDIVDVHLHPRDIGGAIVALDQPRPPGSWRWGGPAWEGAIPEHGPGGVHGATIEAAEPRATAERWAHVLGASVGADRTAIALDGGGAIRFVEGPGRGLVGVDVAGGSLSAPVAMAGVAFAPAGAVPEQAARSSISERHGVTPADRPAGCDDRMDAGHGYRPAPASIPAVVPGEGLEEAALRPA